MSTIKSFIKNRNFLSVTGCFRAILIAFISTFGVDVSAQDNSNLSINVGGDAFIAADGTAYSEDKYFIGGTTFISTADILGIDDTLYQAEREGEFSYNIPLENGTYLVTLKFAENDFTGIGERVFSFDIEDRNYGNLDIFKQVGGAHRSYFKTYEVQVEDGALNLNFNNEGADNPTLSGILIRLPVIVDIAVAYTFQALQEADDSVNLMRTYASKAVEFTNLSLANSGVNIRLRLVDIFAAEDELLENGNIQPALVNRNDGILDNVTDYVTTHGVDIIGVIVGPGQINGVGHAYGGICCPAQGTEENPFFSATYLHEPEVITDDSGTFAHGAGIFAHEAGHVMGLFHTRDPQLPGFSGSYNYGHVARDTDNEFYGSIMNGYNLLPYFSSPEVIYNGYPLGIDPNVDPANGAWAARYLNENAYTIQNLQAAKYPAPTNIEVIKKGNTQVMLQWQDNALREEGYLVSVKDANGQLLKSMEIKSYDSDYDSSDTKTVTINDLLPDTTYSFIIVAFDWMSTPYTLRYSEPYFATTLPLDQPSGLVPGIIEAEHFSVGYDKTVTNQGGEYRDGAVDIGLTADGNDYFVGWIGSGEWLDYEIDVERKGNYKVLISVASANTSDKYISFKNDLGETLSAPINVKTSTSGWEEWVTIETAPIPLEQGVQTIKLLMDSSHFNINKLEFVYDWGVKRFEANDHDVKKNFKVMYTSDIENSGGSYLRGSYLENLRSDLNVLEWHDRMISAGDKNVVFRVRSSDGLLRTARLYIGTLPPIDIDTDSTEWQEIVVPFTINSSESYDIEYRTLGYGRTGGGQILDLDYIDIIDAQIPEPSDVGVPFNSADFDLQSSPENNNIVRDMDTKVGYIKRGEWIRFSDFNFGDGASRFVIRATSNTNGGTLSVRVNSELADPIASVNITSTGSWNIKDAVEFESTVGEVSDVVDHLYFTFEGEGDAYLYDIENFRFEP